MEHCSGVQNIHLSLEIFETGIRFVEMLPVRHSIPLVGPL